MIPFNKLGCRHCLLNKSSIMTLNSQSDLGDTEYMEALLSGQGLVRNFGAFRAVDGIDIHLHPGTITGLIGPNGAGKTTLMLLLSGMLAPDAGTVSVAGLDIGTKPREARSLIGWLPDTFGSWGELRVEEIMTYFGQLYGLDKATAKQRSAELLEQVHLEDMSDRFAHVLSRGQKQRLGVARTLLNHPRVLLLDEPAAGMDPRSRIELRELLREQADDGVAVLISSHVLSELEGTIDDAVFMKAGRVVDTSALSELIEGQAVGSRYRLSVLDSAAFRAFIEAEDFTVFTPAGCLDYEFSAAGPEEAADILARIVAAGVKVSGFGAAPGKPSLEEIYLQIDKGERK